MNLCDAGHDEVCYEGRKCPVCTVKEELEAQLAQVQDELASAKLEIEELENSI